MIDKDGNKREFVEGLDGRTIIEPNGSFSRIYFTKIVTDANGMRRRMHIRDPLSKSQLENFGGAITYERS